MSSLSLSSLLAATKGAVLQSGATEFSGVSTDSRLAPQGSVFFALSGERFDAHEFVAAARSRGALGAVISRAPNSLGDVSGMTLVRVADTRKALGDLARHIRRQYPIPMVAITGSNGKTTTKDFCAAICAQVGPTLATEGNFNNDIGVPLTLFGLGSQHRYGVIEMGMNASGEISYLAGIVRPEVGVITNVASAHLGKLGSLEAIARAKGELFHGLARDGVAVMPADEPLLEEDAAHLSRDRLLRFGESRESDVRLVGASRVGRTKQQLEMELRGKKLVAVIELPGRHNARNALAATAAALALEIDTESIVRGLGVARFSPHRSHWIEAHGLQILDDCYNANPASMVAAFDAAAEAASGVRWIAVLGDMLELGEEGPRLHEELGRQVALRKVHHLICLGQGAASIADGAISSGLDVARVLCTLDAGEAAAAVRRNANRGDVVLVKGSRGARMERVLEHLTREA